MSVCAIQHIPMHTSSHTPVLYFQLTEYQCLSITYNYPPYQIFPICSWFVCHFWSTLSTLTSLSLTIILAPGRSLLLTLDSMWLERFRTTYNVVILKGKVKRIRNSHLVLKWIYLPSHNKKHHSSSSMAAEESLPEQRELSDPLCSHKSKSLG